MFEIQGFRAAAVKSGIRGKDRLDLGLIVSDIPASAAGVFTTNRVKAAPVLLGRERLQGGRVQAILVNSGIANACTGAVGLRQARICGAMAADALGISPELVQLSSTGVIGMALDVEGFRRAIPRLIAALNGGAGADDKAALGLKAVARAIMTTDLVPKTAVRNLSLDGVAVKIAALAKGSGMIMPDMATMLCFILTDAAVKPELLRRMLRSAVAASFNRITVDGDTSPNDTVLLLANGRSGAPLLAAGSPAQIVFQQHLDDLCRDLARQVVRDGEGATKLVTVRVEGATNQAEADRAARTIANSSLVKTAFFGEDANWGRIISALGRSGAVFNPEAVGIAFNDVVMVQNGVGLGAAAEKRATEVLRGQEFTVTVNLRAGGAVAECLTCDFSFDYVRINAAYRS